MAFQVAFFTVSLLAMQAASVFGSDWQRKFHENFEKQTNDNFRLLGLPIPPSLNFPIPGQLPKFSGLHAFDMDSDDMDTMSVHSSSGSGGSNMHMNINGMHVNMDMPESPMHLLSMASGNTKGVGVVAVKQLSKGTDGKTKKEGGWTVVTSKDGQIQEFKGGNKPPPLDVKIKMPSMPKMHNFEHQKPMKPTKTKKFNMFNDLDDPMVDDDTFNFLRVHVPLEGTTYTGQSTSFSSNTQTINGVVVKDESKMDVVNNNNGNVKEEAASIKKCD